MFNLLTLGWEGGGETTRVVEERVRKGMRKGGWGGGGGGGGLFLEILVSSLNKVALLKKVGT